MRAPTKIDKDARYSREAMGERLHLLRVALRVPQLLIAETCGLQPYTWNAVERGRAYLSWQYAVLIKEKTGCTLDYIFTGDMGGLDPKLVKALKAARHRLLKKHANGHSHTSMVIEKLVREEASAEAKKLLAQRRAHLARGREEWQKNLPTIKLPK